jgi:hypothetical protein
MMKLTGEQKEKMAHEILELLQEYDLTTDIRIYFNGKCLTGEGSITENKRGSDYFKYANDDMLSMSFEGDFYEVINNYCAEMADIVMPKFVGILGTYGLYYEMGETWNLAVHHF